jgi:hypothetical protein
MSVAVVIIPAGKNSRAIGSPTLLGMGFVLPAASI